MTSNSNSAQKERATVHRRRDILVNLFKRFNLSQRQVSRNTAALSEAGKGVYLDPHQLNKFLKGKLDITGRSLEALEIAIAKECPQASAFYHSEVGKMMFEISVTDDSKTETT